jgi:hypothetical protein
MPDVGPQLIAFDAVDMEPDHHPVVQLRSAAADSERQASDRLAIGFGEPHNCTLADAFTKRGDDLDLLVARKDVEERSFASGPSPGLVIGDRLRANGVGPT